MQNGAIKISNVRIGPFQVETIKLRAAFLKASMYNLNPTLSYVDDLGKTRTKKSDPITITVQLGSLEDKSKSTTEPLEAQFEFKSKAAENAFNFLVKAFKEDYIANRMFQEKSGWRTLMEIVRNAPSNHAQHVRPIWQRRKSITGTGTPRPRRTTFFPRRKRPRRTRSQVADML